MQTIDLIGVFVRGIRGLMTMHQDFDVVGVAILAVVTAGGGPCGRAATSLTRREYENGHAVDERYDVVVVGGGAAGPSGA